MENTRIFIDNVNQAASIVATALFLLGLVSVVVIYTVTRIRYYSKKYTRGGAWKGLYLGFLALIEMGFFAYGIGFFPNHMAFITHGRVEAHVFRWILLFLCLPMWVFFMTRKHSGWRGFHAMLAVLGIGLIGWSFEKWFGVLLFSVPVYVSLLYMIYHLAQAVLPMNEPWNKKEGWLKFKVFLLYLLGIQYPFWVVETPASREIKIHVSGNPTVSFLNPGTVWTRTHQVVGVSAGIEFDHVDGPGILFTDQHQRPVAVVDLRTQIRRKQINTVTKDGVPIKLVVQASFVVDYEDWPKHGWKRDDFIKREADGKRSALLKESMTINRRIGSFPYSTSRIKSLLSTVGVKTETSFEEGEILYWDDWTLLQITNTARQVISQRTLDELWSPSDEKVESSAYREIGQEIKEIAEPRLRRVGILLLEALVVNYDISGKSPIRKQQIESWKKFWSQRISAIQTEAEKIYKEEIEKAHAAAKSELLDNIAGSVMKARAIDSKLPRHVLALYFIHAIEEYAKKQDSAEGDEAKKNVEMVKQILLYNNEEQNYG